MMMMYCVLMCGMCAAFLEGWGPVTLTHRNCMQLATALQNAKFCQWCFLPQHASTQHCTVYPHVPTCWSESGGPNEWRQTRPRSVRLPVGEYVDSHGRPLWLPPQDSAIKHQERNRISPARIWLAMPPLVLSQRRQKSGSNGPKQRLGTLQLLNSMDMKNENVKHTDSQLAQHNALKQSLQEYLINGLRRLKIKNMRLIHFYAKKKHSLKHQPSAVGISLDWEPAAIQVRFAAPSIQPSTLRENR